MKILCTGASGFIGTNLVDSLLEKNITLLNVDIKEPSKSAHQKYWRECDLLDVNQLRAIFEEFQPTHIVHLAAETKTDSNYTKDNYRSVTNGTANVLDAIKSTPSVERVIITSTQFVHRPGNLPEHDEDFDPHTVYGQCKVISEQLTRSANLSAVWTIIRPTNIWGPWHPRYPREFWHVLKKGWYFHPGGESVIRSYGYVGNVVFQIEKILQAPCSLVDHKVYYVGDIPVRLIDWVNGFSRAITGRNARVVPSNVIRVLALIGDGLAVLGIKFPIHTSRYRSMTEDYLTPMAPTIKAFGEPPYSLDDGIRETIQWLEKQGYN